MSQLVRKTTDASLVRALILGWGVVFLFVQVGCGSGGSQSDDLSGTGDAQPEMVQSDGRVSPPDATDTTLPEEVAAEVSNSDWQGLWDSWADLPTLQPEKSFSTRYAAGVARRLVNTDDPVYLGGFGFCLALEGLCRKSEGVHDDISASAVALADTETGEVVIFVGLDSPGLVLFDMHALHDRIPKLMQDTYGVRFDGERLAVAASHAHSTPDGVGLWGPMLGDERDNMPYIEMMLDEILAAAVEAYGDLQDVELVWGKGIAPNHDDDVPHDDEDIFVIKGDAPSGETVFTLTRWNAHPTAYGSDNNGLSADYLGPFRKKMEEETGGLSIYLNGPIGSVYTDKPACAEGDAFPGGWQDPDLSEASHSTVACVGYNLADETLLALEQAQPLAETGIRFRHTTFEFHPTNYLFANLAKLDLLPFETMDVDDPDSLYTSEFSWITVGELEYVTTPGESFPSFGAHIAQTLEDAGYTNAVVLGLTQDWMGYLMSEEQYYNEELDYHRALSPGITIEAEFLKKLAELIEIDDR